MPISSLSNRNQVNAPDFNSANLTWLDQLKSRLSGLLGYGSPTMLPKKAATIDADRRTSGVQKSPSSGNSLSGSRSGNSVQQRYTSNGNSQYGGSNASASAPLTVTATRPGQVAGISNRYDAIFQEAAQLTGLSANLLKAQAWQESKMNPNAISRCGAIGIMQVMPGTAKYIGLSNPFDAYESILKGADYLKTQIDKFDGNVSLGLAAYNAGAGNVKNGTIPQNGQTPGYVSNILGYKEELDNASVA